MITYQHCQHCRGDDDFGCPEEQMDANHAVPCPEPEDCPGKIEQ